MSIIETIGPLGAMRAVASLGCEGEMRTIASSLPPNVSPQAGPHTDILRCNRRRHKNCSNLLQRRRENAASDSNS
jgi:hypothetical protein